MVPLSPNPSDRELVLAVIAGKTTARSRHSPAQGQ